MEINQFSYGGVCSGEFMISCGTERHSILPTKRKYVQEIIGVDGVADYGIKGYDVRVITLPIYYDGPYHRLRADREKIAAWLHNDGKPKKLIFGSEPDRYYLAKIYAALDFNVTSDRYIGDIQFECNPPWLYLTDGTQLTPEEIVWLNCSAENNQFIKEFTQSGSIRFYNKGNPARPIIKVIGRIRSGLELRYKDESITLNTDLFHDGFAVDCNAETVTRLSDGASLYEYLSPDDNFFEIDSGKAEISLSMPDIGPYPNEITVFIEMQIPTGG